MQNLIKYLENNHPGQKQLNFHYKNMLNLYHITFSLTWKTEEKFCFYQSPTSYFLESRMCSTFEDMSLALKPIKQMTGFPLLPAAAPSYLSILYVLKHHRDHFELK